PCIMNLPATVESASPNLFADQVEWFCRGLSRNRHGRDAVIVSLHTHKDRGGAAAAAELGLLAGADRVEGTLLGNGERTGNMDLITMAMNLYSQGVDPRLDLSNPDRIIAVVEGCTGMACHPRHPWVGELVYTAFSGSHQDAINKSLKQQRSDAHRTTPWQVAYLPVDPADLGRSYEAVIRVNSQSGKGGVAFVLEREFGLCLPRWLQQAFAPIVQRVSEERGGTIDAETIRALFVDHFVRDDAPARLLGYRLSRNGRDHIDVRLRMDGIDQRIDGTGDGAIAAFGDAWTRLTGQPVNVLDYQEHAIGSGTDAEAAAYVQLAIDGQPVAGAAIDRDTVGASLKAVLSALNRVSADQSEGRHHQAA
ncbi:MAG: 2-isopropylmalate synthase, partial [Thiohalocapsa sp.]